MDRAAGAHGSFNPLGGLVGIAVLPASGETPRISLRPRKALAFFHGAETASIAEFLGRLRPAPLSPALRAQVMASLPAEGELRATDAERAKLAALEPVFDFHGRKDVLEVKVIDVGHAFVGLHARTVLLVSRDALALVTPQELQALAAHELGHEYVWDEYWTAMTTQTHARMQELELVCDGIAVMTLRALGLQPARLVDAVTKVAGERVPRRALRWWDLEGNGSAASHGVRVSGRRRLPFQRRDHERMSDSARGARMLYGDSRESVEDRGGLWPVV